MRLKPDGQDLGLDLRKRGGGAATPIRLCRKFQPFHYQFLTSDQSTHEVLAHFYFMLIFADLL